MAIVVVLAILILGGIAIYVIIQLSQGVVAGGQAGAGIVVSRDRQASVTHNPSQPVLTSDQNNLVWTYNVTGLFSEINSFTVGPIDPDIITSNLLVNVPGWTATRSGQFVFFTGPANVPEGVIATASFQTSADALIELGALQAKIFVDIIPAMRGVRDVTTVTFVPTKPN